MSLWDWGKRAFGLTDGEALVRAFGTSTWAGKSVTPEGALQLVTLFAAIRMRSRTLSTLPIGFYERQGDNKRVAADGHWLADILETSPNADQTPAEFWEGLYGCVSLRGNFYARKGGLRGSVADRSFASLETMHPDQVTRKREGGRIVFDWVDPDGTRVTLPEDEVWHVKGFSFGDSLGIPALHAGRQVIGSALSADQQAAKFFKSGLQQSGFLSVDQELKKGQREALQKIMDEYTGSTNAGKLMILEAGMEYKSLSLKPEEAQLLLTRRFHIEELCRLVGVPPIMIGHAPEGQTMFGSGVEQLFLYWLQTDIRPQLVGVEQSIKKHLLPAKDRRRYYAEHAVEGLLRADSAGRAALYDSLIRNAVMKPGEARSRENLDYDAEADALLVMSNLVRLADLGKTPAADVNARNALRAWLLSTEGQGIAA